MEILKSEHPSRPCNPDIANTMFRAGFIETWGRGTVEIINDCLEYGMEEPDYDLISGGVKITFYAVDQEKISGLGSEKGSEKSSVKSSEKTTGKTSGKTSVKIIAFLEHNNQLTIAELSKEIGLSTRAIEKNLKKLQESGQLKRVGSDRAGYWEIIEDAK